MPRLPRILVGTVLYLLGYLILLLTTVRVCLKNEDQVFGDGA